MGLEDASIINLLSLHSKTTISLSYNICSYSIWNMWPPPLSFVSIWEKKYNSIFAIKTLSYEMLKEFINNSETDLKVRLQILVDILFIFS